MFSSQQLQKIKDISIKKYDYIDALRGFVILGVILVHTSQWVVPTSVFLSQLVAEGARGGQLFFIASALTLFLSMKARKQYEPQPLLSFYIRRFFRIAPLFYLAIIVYTWHDGMSPSYWAPNGIEWWHILLTVFFLHGWNPETITSVVPGGWSIAVEMTFYLFLPYLFIKLNNVKSSLIALFGSLLVAKLASTVLLFLFSPNYPDTQQYLVYTFSTLWFFSELPIFILGILLYHIITKCPDKDRTVGLLFLFVSIFLFIAFLTPQTFNDLLPKHFLYGIAFLFFALSLYFYPNEFLVNKITILIGKLSFSLYLVHFMVLNKIAQFIKITPGDIGFILAFLLCLLFSILFSYITHNLIEIPGIRLGKKVIEKVRFS